MCTDRDSIHPSDPENSFFCFALPKYYFFSGEHVKLMLWDRDRRRDGNWMIIFCTFFVHLPSLHLLYAMPKTCMHVVVVCA